MQIRPAVLVHADAVLKLGWNAFFVQWRDGDRVVGLTAAGTTVIAADRAGRLEPVARGGGFGDRGPRFITDSLGLAVVRVAVLSKPGAASAC